jgi:enoyl-CoA hydratase
MSRSARGSVLVEHPAPQILLLRLNRPEKRNAIDRDLVERLIRGFEGVEESVVVLGSTDPHVFSAGADVSLTDAERSQVSDSLYQLYERMVRLPVPIIAAISGHAVAAGAQLAIASDVRIGEVGTRIRFVGPDFGLAVGTWGLPSLIGRGRTMEICLTTRTVAAEESLRIGLLDRLSEDPEREALVLAAEIARLDRDAVGNVKRLVRDSTGLVIALNEERQANGEAWARRLAYEARGGAGS